MIDVPLKEVLRRIKEKSGFSDERINSMILAKLDQLSGLVSKEGAVHIIANEMGIKLETKETNEEYDSDLEFEEVRNNYGLLSYIKLFFDDETFFILDKKGYDFFINHFYDGDLIVDNGYLAKYTSEGIKYFHREFKYYLTPFDLSLVIHHKNGRKYDNRNFNLQILSEYEHDCLHNEKYVEKAIKNQEKYEKKRERNMFRKKIKKKFF